MIEIGLPATKIRNPDNLVVIVPNNEFVQRKVINYTMSGAHIRLRIPFSCAYDPDIEKRSCSLRKLPRKYLACRWTTEPIVVVRRFGPSGVNP